MAAEVKKVSRGHGKDGRSLSIGNGTGRCGQLHTAALEFITRGLVHMDYSIGGA
jgi:hypothetical protein